MNRTHHFTTWANYRAWHEQIAVDLIVRLEKHLRAGGHVSDEEIAAIVQAEIDATPARIEATIEQTREEWRRLRLGLD